MISHPSHLKNNLMYCLKTILNESPTFSKARMIVSGKKYEFFTADSLLVWLKANTPEPNSFVLLEDGSWIRWMRYTDGYSVDYSYWEHLKCPSW